MIKIEGLSVTAKDGANLLKNISLSVEKGSILGLTGASGSGKTTLLRAIMGTLPPNHKITNGSIFLNETKINTLQKQDYRKLCGTTLGYIPQNPMNAFDARLKMGRQLSEILVLRLHINKREAKEALYEKMALLNLQDRERIWESYPSQISGGMLQRVAIALLLCLSPEYILADEPTSALDQGNAELLVEILKEQSKARGILFISHDMKAMALLCKEVAVIESGRIIEEGSFLQLMSEPQSAWTKAFSSLWQLNKEGAWLWEAL